MDEPDRCDVGERLIKLSSTWISKIRLEQHLKTCKICQERFRAEAEMTRLFEQAGEWKEDTAFADKIKKLVSELPVPQDRFIDRILRRLGSKRKMLNSILLFITLILIVYFLLHIR